MTQPLDFLSMQASFLNPLACLQRWGEILSFSRLSQQRDMLKCLLLPNPDNYCVCLSGHIIQREISPSVVEEKVICLFLILSSLSTLSSLFLSSSPMHICLVFLPIMFDKKRALSSISLFPLSFRPQGRLVATTWQSVKLERPIHAPNRFLFFPAPSTFPPTILFMFAILQKLNLFYLLENISKSCLAIEKWTAIGISVCSCYFAS